MAIHCDVPQHYFGEYRSGTRESYQDYPPHAQEDIDGWIVAYDAKQFPRVKPADQEQGVEERFRRLADEWQADTRSMSSLSAIASHPKYQEIIRLGKDVIPFLLSDLESNKRFWLPALHAITGIQPFDRSDYGNANRMIQAWLTWGKRKGII